MAPDGGTQPAIVVLGCTVRDGVPSAALRRRVALGARAYREGVAPVLVASGGKRWGGRAEATVMAALLERADVPRQAIRLELCSLSTVENAWYCAELLAPLGIRSVVVATCSWHEPRALAAFARCGLAAVAPPACWRAEPPAPLWLRAAEQVRRRFDALMLARAGRTW